MHVCAEYANVCLWPKAAIETESNSGVLNGCFGEKSGRSVLKKGPCRAGFLTCKKNGTNYATEG